MKVGRERQTDRDRETEREREREKWERAKEIIHCGFLSTLEKS